LVALSKHGHSADARSGVVHIDTSATVAVVVDVGMVEVVVAIVVVAMVDELQDAKALDATKEKLNNAQMVPFFKYPSLLLTVCYYVRSFNIQSID
jgi:hypothetical protein